MVLNGGSTKSKECFQFKWDTEAKDITNNVSRNIKSTVKEKHILINLILNLFLGGGEIS
jgi:hypothetical protein